MILQELLDAFGEIPYFSRIEFINNVMQYLSPAAFLGESVSGPLDKKAIQLGRKKLFADLELSGGSTIELHGKSFTKNDIIQYLENLLKEGVLSYHSAVNEDRVLLAFLEEAHLERNNRFQNNPLYEQEQFIEWISPYFHNSFMAFMNACFLQPNEDKLVALLDNRLLMTPRDIEMSWDAVVRIILNDLSALEQFLEQRNDSNKVSMALVTSLMEYSYIRMIMLLPEGRFANLRDEFALCMQGVCIDIFNSNKQLRSDVRTWMDNAILLASTQEVKEMLAGKLAEMEEAIRANQSDRGSSSSFIIPSKFLFFALFLLIKIATCNSLSSNPKVEFHPSPQQLHVLDSIFNKRVDTFMLTLPEDSILRKRSVRPLVQ